MRCYEHTFIARQDLSAQQAQGLAETVTQLITGHGGEVSKTEYWGLRNLAYRIRKNRKGHYLHLNVRATADTVAELERTLRLNEDVIRFLTVQVEELDNNPSAVLQSRGGRDDRPRRRDDDDRPRRRGDDDRDRDRGERVRRSGDEDRPPRRAEATTEGAGGAGATGVGGTGAEGAGGAGAAGAGGEEAAS
jgi:small subunit ribosomal protein S6